MQKILVMRMNLKWHKEKGSKNFALGKKTFKRGQDYRKQQNGSHDQNEK